MNINFKGETFDLACHYVEIENMMKSSFFG